MMNPIQSISSVFRNYVNFSGRAQRSEFWWFTLFSVVSQALLNWVPFVGWIYGLALLLPSLAVTVRRLHDTGRSAWWLLIYLGIAIGWIVGMVILIVSVASQDDQTIREELQEELGFRVSQSELEEIRLVCLEPDEWELSEEEQEEKDTVCGIVHGGLFRALGALIFLILWTLVSLAGWITILILCAMPGTRGPNSYGPDPLQPDTGTGGYGGPDNIYGSSSLPGTVTEDMPQTGARLYCSQCGAERTADARFCTVCGTSF